MKQTPYVYVDACMNKYICVRIRVFCVTSGTSSVNVHDTVRSFILKFMIPCVTKCH